MLTFKFSLDGTCKFNNGRSNLEESADWQRPEEQCFHGVRNKSQIINFQFYLHKEKSGRLTGNENQI